MRAAQAARLLTSRTVAPAVRSIATRSSGSSSGSSLSTAALARDGRPRVAAAAAAAAAAASRAPVSEILSNHAARVMSGFCAAHGVEPTYDVRPMGTARRPRHVCTLHLPLPPPLADAFGYTKLVRTGALATRKRAAVLAAIQKTLLELHEDAGLNTAHVKLCLTPPPIRTPTQPRL